MGTPTVVDILNELLADEQRGIVHRLAESIVFVSPLATDDLERVRHIERASRKNAATLAELILDLGGPIGPRIGDPTSADLHFQDLRRTLPRLILEHESLVRKYSLAAEKVMNEPRAAELVSRICQCHRQHLTTLRTSQDQSVSCTN